MTTTNPAAPVATSAPATVTPPPPPAAPSVINPLALTITYPAPSETSSLKVGAVYDVAHVDVFADPNDNTRKTLDGVEDLAMSIASHGLKQNVAIRLNPSAGKKTAAHPNGEPRFRLTAGFRRFAASQKVPGRTHIKALYEGALTDAVARDTNLLENLNRRNVSEYDTAHALLKYRQEGMSDAAIAEKLKGASVEGGAKTYSESHIGNLCRVAAKVIPSIQEEWRKAHPKAKLRDLVTLAGMPEDKQQAAWDALVNGTPAPEAGANGGGGEDGANAGAGATEPKKSRPTSAALAAIIAELEAGAKEGKLDKATVAVAVGALRLATGEQNFIPGLYGEQPKKKGQAAKDAKKGGEKGTTKAPTVPAAKGDTTSKPGAKDAKK